MKMAMKYILFLFVGLFIGATVMWVTSYSKITNSNEQPSEPSIQLSDVLSFSRVAIIAENNACEGIVKPEVGDVIASIFEANSLYKRNMMSYGCGDDQCVLSVTNCMPWQSADCGSRMLFFRINNQKEIDATSFKCIDMP